MSIILQKMIHEILPPSKRPPSPNYVPANTLPSTVMAKTVKNVFTKGWVDIRSLYTLEYLVNLCGTDWFADRLVKVRNSLNTDWFADRLVKVRNSLNTLRAGWISEVCIHLST